MIIVATSDELRSAIASGNVIMSVLTDTLSELRNYAFNYLVELQKNIIDIHRVHAVYSSLRLEPDTAFGGKDRLNTMMTLSTRKPFIHYNTRLKFRRSPLYNKPVSNEILDKNRSIFLYSYLVFIDGYLDVSAKVRCKEDVTDICLSKFAMEPELAKKFKDGCNIDIVFLKNMQHITTSINAKKLRDANCRFRLSKNANIPDGSEIMLVPHKKGMLRKVFPVVIEDEMFKVPLGVLTGFEDTDDISLDIYTIPHAYESFDVQPVTNVHTLGSTRTMPLPEENFLTFVKRIDGSMYLDNRKMFEMKYPCTFRMTKPNDLIGSPLHIVGLYWENHTNEHLMGFDEDLFEYPLIKGAQNIIQNETIANYVPFKYKYDIPEFLAVNDDSKNYKHEKMLSIFKKWAVACQRYNENIRKNLKKHILRPRDLESKLRRNNHLEITNGNYQVEFPEDRYVFIFINTDAESKLPLQFWIDGYRYVPDHVYLDGAYQYVYIQKELIKENSVIEIERSTVNRFSVEMNVQATVANRVNLGKNRCRMDSLFVTKLDGTIVDKSQLTFTAVIEGERVRIHQDSKLILEDSIELEVKGVDDQLRFICNDKSIEVEVPLTTRVTDSKDINVGGVIHSVYPKPTRYRIFKKGLLVPPSAYLMDMAKKVDGSSKLWLNSNNTVSVYQIDYIPEGYKHVYHQNYINSHGLIDLNGKIDKPFSNKYYDVYVNGLRISPNRIRKLANFGIVILNLHVLRNLDIYERDVDDTYYKYDIESNQLSDKLFEADDDYKKELEKKYPEVKDDTTIPNIIDMEDRVKRDIFDIIFEKLEYEGLFTLDDVTSYIADEFFDKFDADGVFFINADNKYPVTRHYPDGEVRFLAPQRSNEYERINYVEYTDDLDDSITSTDTPEFVNAAESFTISSRKYPTLKNMDVLMVGGADIRRIDDNVAIFEHEYKAPPVLPGYDEPTIEPDPEPEPPKFTPYIDALPKDDTYEYINSAENVNNSDLQTLDEDQGVFYINADTKYKWDTYPEGDVRFMAPPKVTEISNINNVMYSEATAKFMTDMKKGYLNATDEPDQVEGYDIITDDVDGTIFIDTGKNINRETDKVELNTPE